MSGITTLHSLFPVLRQSPDWQADTALSFPCCSAVWGAALFVVTLSLGESFWSPRWYDYSMSLAPHCREGIFTALASAPLFAAKLPTGATSRPHIIASCTSFTELLY